MEDIQSLLEKINREGVEKAEAEAKRIVDAANAKADKIVDEYGSLPELMDDIEQNPARLDDLGVDNPTILADSLYRMWGKRA